MNDDLHRSILVQVIKHSWGQSMVHHNLSDVVFTPAPVTKIINTGIIKHSAKAIPILLPDCLVSEICSYVIKFHALAAVVNGERGAPLTPGHLIVTVVSKSKYRY